MNGWEIKARSAVPVSSAHNELQAALVGGGLAHVFEDYATPYLKDGRLTEVLKDWSPRLPSWYFYYPSKRHSSAAMRALVTILRSYDWKVA